MDYFNISELLKNIFINEETAQYNTIRDISEMKEENSNVN